MIATPTVGANVRKEEIDALATPRTIQGIATLAPNLTERSPNAGQVVINGAFAWDNVFMVNGVDVNDNLFAHAAEPVHRGRHRGNHGADLRHLRRVRPLQRRRRQRGDQERRQHVLGQLAHEPAQPVMDGGDAVRAIGDQPGTGAAKSVTEYPDDLQNTHEGTFGGPIVRDRLWFFGAGRYQKTDTPFTLPETGINLSSNDLNKRGEIKLTGTVATNHTLQGGYLNNYRERTNNSGLQSFIIDPASEVDRTNPNMYYFTNYRGVRGTTLFEAQYSQRKFKFADDGGTSTNIVDSPFFSLTCACLYNAPYFDATDPENRNNQQITGNVTKFWNGSRPPRDQGRLRVLPQPAHWRQLAVVDVVRVQCGLRDAERPAHSALRPRRDLRRELRRHARRDDERQQPFGVRPGSLGRSATGCRPTSACASSR